MKISKEEAAALRNLEWYEKRSGWAPVLEPTRCTVKNGHVAGLRALRAY